MKSIMPPVPRFGVRLVRETKAKEPIKVEGPSNMGPLLEWMKDLPQEHFVVIMFDVKMQVIGYTVVSKGSLTCSIVHPRDVFSPAILANAHCIMVAHNHPSGNTRASLDDIEITKQLLSAGRVLGIPVVDHFIVADRLSSLREEDERISDYLWSRMKPGSDDLEG